MAPLFQQPFMMAWDSINRSVELSWDLEENFASDNWVHNDSGKTSVSGGTLNLINTRDGSNDACVRDISSFISGGELSGEFYMQFDINGDVAWGTGGDSVFAFGVASGDQTVDSNDVQDWMGMELRNNTGERRIGAIWKNGGTTHVTDANNVNAAFSWASATTYYCRIYLSGTSLTVSVTTNSDYVTGATKATSTSVTGMSAVKYLKFHNIILSGGSKTDFDGYIDNLKIISGQSTPP